MNLLWSTNLAVLRGKNRLFCKEPRYFLQYRGLVLGKTVQKENRIGGRDGITRKEDHYPG